MLPSSNEKIDRLDINSLKVEPYTGYVDPQLFVEIQVEHRAEILGPIHHRFQLEARSHNRSNFSTTPISIQIFIIFRLII